ncbi:MAG: hypothetical protein HDR53_02235 [Treponema sp.]|nr:hypothetical protein [Treponema sp.]
METEFPTEEIWLEYNDDGKEVHRKKSNGEEEWTEYDANGVLLCRKYSNSRKRRF